MPANGKVSGEIEHISFVETFLGFPSFMFLEVKIVKNKKT